ncbi:MAG: family 20 glycosylhydrolase [Prevotella sp.]|nr:family 20 glycosylhydrolase [Prevotella sp.]
MKRIIVILLATVTFAVADAQVSLVPKPQKAVWNAGEYQMPQAVSVAYASANLQKAAQYLCTSWQKEGGVKATAKAGKQGDVRLSLKKGKKGSYRLVVDDKGVELVGADYEGIVSGIATLRQLALLSEHDGHMPFVSISDAPRFGWRGFHLDCSRHFFTVKEVEELINLMALYKINRFHWHLTDDQGWRIEIKKYPLLTERGAWRIPNNQDTICAKQARETDNVDMLLPRDRWNSTSPNEAFTSQSAVAESRSSSLYGGYYTQDDIREIVAYARERGIEIVPEIDMPGHFLSAIENYDGLSCFKEVGWGEWFTTPLCPGKDKVFDFCRDIWDEVIALFPYEYVHIGGDEVRKDNWERCPDCQQRIREQGLKDEFELQAWFIHQMENYLNKRGRKMIGWDEILEGGLSKTSTVSWWRTWVPDAVDQVTAHGNDVIYCPGSPFYLSSPDVVPNLRSIYEYELQPAHLSAKQRQHIIGVQANMWTEWIPTRERMLYMFFPAMTTVAELAWTMPEQKDFADYDRRLTGQLSMLHRLGIPYRTPALEGFGSINAFVREGTLNVTCKDRLATVRYTTDGTFPNSSSPLYTGPITVDQTTPFILRAFNPEGRPDALVPATFVKQGYLEPVASPTSKLTPGLTATWYEYGGQKCADITTAPLKGDYAVDDVCIPEGVKGKIGLVVKGYLNVPADGIYTFALMSDDGSWLKIDGNMVVDNDRPQSPHEEVCQQALRQGLHYLELRYFDSNGGMLRLYVVDEQGNRLNPADIYRH